MGMTQEEFAALVGRMEVEAEARPLGYKLRVLGLAALPYLYVFSALALAVALIGAMVAGLVFADKAHGALLKLVFKGSSALGLLVFAILRALWVKEEPPEGEALDPAEHPVLFAEIERVRKAVGAPPAHVVMLDARFNAAISQYSRLGLLGWQKNTLYLGLPLMRALSPEQFRAVLAHEFGHLAGAHGRAGAWIYRCRKRWGGLLATLEKDDHWATFVFRPFLRWYAPFFNATSFVSARGDEYQADLAGAEATTPREMGDALCALGLRGRQLDEEYWPAIRKRMDEAPEPDVRPHTSMHFEPLLPQTAKSWLSDRLAVETGIADTHPSLTDRLASLGVEPRAPEPPSQSAAAAWFGDKLGDVSAQLDADWREWIHERWTEHYESLSVRRERLAELDTKQGEPLPDSLAWEHAELVEELRTSEEALALHQALVERDPDHAGANFAVGRLLIAKQDDAGLASIERAIERTETAIIPGAEWAVPFLREAGREEEAERWVERYRVHKTKLEEDENDRSCVWYDEHYCAPDVEPAALEAIVSFLADQPDVTRAWLLRRKTLHYQERPWYVLVVRRKARVIDWFSDEKEKAADLELQARLVEGPGLAGEYFVYVTNRIERKNRNLLEGFEGTQIFDRSG